MSVYAKLAKVQVKLKVPKSKYNSFGKYYYRNAEDIFDAAKKECEANGLLLVVSDSVEEIGGWHYTKAQAMVIDIEDGSNVCTSAYAREALEKKGMDESQISGTASSYARKYALGGLFLLDDTKDADTDEYHNTTQKPANVPNGICADCGKPIVDTEIGGKMYHAAAIINSTYKNYGVCLCAECGHKRKEGAK